MAPRRLPAPARRSGQLAATRCLPVFGDEIKSRAGAPANFSRPIHFQPSLLSTRRRGSGSSAAVAAVDAHHRARHWDPSRRDGSVALCGSRLCPRPDYAARRNEQGQEDEARADRDGEAPSGARIAPAGPRRPEEARRRARLQRRSR